MTGREYALHTFFTVLIYIYYIMACSLYLIYGYIYHPKLEIILTFFERMSVAQSD